MVIDHTGIRLTPGNSGKDCVGNGSHKEVECCCEECDYLLCCSEYFDPLECLECDDAQCPHSRCCSV